MLHENCYKVLNAIAQSYNRNFSFDGIVYYIVVNIKIFWGLVLGTRLILWVGLKEFWLDWVGFNSFFVGL